jgi:hypothetical protein
MMRALKPGDSIEIVHEEVPPELRCGGFEGIGKLTDFAYDWHLLHGESQYPATDFERRAWKAAYKEAWMTKKHYGHLRQRRGLTRLLCKIGRHRPVLSVVGDIGVLTCCHRVKMGRKLR